MSVYFLIFVLFSSIRLVSQDFLPKEKLLVLGSSVASGWVTSHKEKWDFGNGYAQRLGRYLNDKSLTVINKSIPGDDTKYALERFDKDVLPEDPDYVLIALSMSNEGLETKNPDTVSMSFWKGINKLVQKCRKHDIQPLLGLCYANNNFTEEQYAYLQKMNIRLRTLGIPCINFLGALNDGQGHIPKGYFFDPNHPDNHGHEEFFLAFPEGMFLSMRIGKSLPQQVHTEGTQLGKKAKTEQLYYIPKIIVHSFSFGFDFIATKSGTIAEIVLDNKELPIRMNKQNRIEYQGLEHILESNTLKMDDWNSIVICHNYAGGFTELYLNGELTGQINERFETAGFILAADIKNMKCRNMFFTRAALNPMEVSEMDQVADLPSLELYAPLNKGEVQNYALSDAKLIDDFGAFVEQLCASKKNIVESKCQRDHELYFPPKQVIRIDPASLDEYSGRYVIEGDDAFLVYAQGNKLYFEDRGRSSEILPEKKDVFFILYPGELLFTFERNENGTIENLIANFNGHKIKGKRQ